MFDKELINKYYPNAECIPPMLIWKLPSGKENMLQKVCENGEYFGQVKIDGFFYQFEKTEDGNCYFFSRNVSKTTGLLTEKIDSVPHLKAVLENIPNGTIILGEVYVPNGTSKDVTHILGCLPKEAINRQEKEGYLHYYIHDLIKLNNENLSSIGAQDRYEKLKNLWDEISVAHPSDYIHLAEYHDENLFDFINDSLAKGEEGVVLKKKTAPYTSGKRPAWDTIKVKKMDSIDAICTGFCPPTKIYTGKELPTWQYWEVEKKFCQIDTDGSICKRYLDGDSTVIPVTKPYFLNQMTAMEISAYNSSGKLVQIGTISSGLTDELRTDFSTIPDAYLNKVVEINCMEKDSAAKTLRHGYFVRFRDDKNPDECKIENIF